MSNNTNLQTTQRTESDNGIEVATRREYTSGNRGIVCTTFEELWRMATAIAKSGLAPKGITSPEAIFVALQMGMEVGLPHMAALQSIAVINGRPGIYGDAALALVRSNPVFEFFLEMPTDNAVHALATELAVAMEFGEIDECKRIRKAMAVASVKIKKDAEDFGYTAISRRKGSMTSVITRFTWADAKRAKLAGKQGPWSEYPERMLMWRARGFNLRDSFGDVLRGMATVEEIRDVHDAIPMTVKSSAQSVADAVNAKFIEQSTQVNTADVANLGAVSPQPPVDPQTGEEQGTKEETKQEKEDKPTPIAPLEEFLITLNETAEALGVSPAATGEWWRGYLLANRLKGKEDKITGPQFAAALTAFSEQHKKG